MSTPSYRAAIIGVGPAKPRTWAKGGGHKIGYHHAEGLNRLPGVKVVSAADINPENLAAFQAEFGLTSGFTDYREMLAREKPDIVGICTYVGLHAEMILACIRAGVRIILSEKPFVSSPAEFKAVSEAVAASGVVLGIAHIRRFAPCFEKARDLVRSGALGDPVMMGGGLGGWDLSEFGSHWIDLMRFLRDDLPVSYVMGQARVRDLRGYGHAMEDHALAYFEFADGCRGVVDGGRSFAPPEGSPFPQRPGWDIHVLGTRGMLAITENKEIRVADSTGFRVVPVDEPYDAWTLLYGSLLTQHQGGEESRVSFRRCGPSAEINLGAYLSALRGDRIDLPLSGRDLEHARWPVEDLAELARKGASRA
jgi:predicted dehydrogenase